MKTLRKITVLLPIIMLLFFLVATAEACDRGSCQEAQSWGAGQEQEQTQEPPPAVTPTPTVTPGPLWGIGQPWVDTTDEGYCPGFYPYQTAAAPPVLSWPLHNPVLHDGRAFRVGHTGLDLDAAPGTAVKVAAPGTVVWAGETDFFGNDALIVAVHHGYGWMTFYVHLSAVNVVCGQSVQTGDVVGAAGMTGASNFAHLHFELRSGSYAYNPLGYLP